MGTDEHNNGYLSTAKVRARYDGIGDSTLRRWVKNEELKFPQPTIIGNRWFFKLSDLEHWERQRAAKTKELKEHMAQTLGPARRKITIRR